MEEIDLFVKEMDFVILKKIAIFQNSEYDKEYVYTKHAVRVLSENGIFSYLSEDARPFFENEVECWTASRRTR